MPNGSHDSSQLLWKDLAFETRDQLTGKLNGLYGAIEDEGAFNSLSIDKQQALLLLQRRLNEKELWHTVRRIENVYGEGGVGMAFKAWPMLESTLRRRRDFTKLFARHRRTSGGFYERGTPRAALHFIFQKGTPVRWFVHFDLHNPVFSPRSFGRHLCFEVLGTMKPDWRQIKASLQRQARAM
jgi:hypothetical protein